MIVVLSRFCWFCFHSEIQGPILCVRSNRSHPRPLQIIEDCEAQISPPAAIGTSAPSRMFYLRDAALWLIAVYFVGAIHLLLSHPTDFDGAEWVEQHDPQVKFVTHIRHLPLNLDLIYH